MATPTLNSIIGFEKASDSTHSATRNESHDARLYETPTQDQLDAMAIGVSARYTGPSLPQGRGSIELDAMPTGKRSRDKRPSVSRPPTVHSRATSSTWLPEDMPMASKPCTPEELESSRPTSPAIRDSVGVVQTFWNPPMNRWRVLGACLICMGNGMNDSAPGALLPYMEKYYQIGYAIVSLIFVGNAIGFILAAFSVHALDSKLGRSKSLMLCDVVMTFGYIMMAVTPPFPVFAVAFVVTGWGMATTLALNNVFCANLANATIILGCFHGAYGIGGVIAPIIATSFVKGGILFSRFYIIMVGHRVVCLFFGGWAFRDFERDRNSHDGLLPPSGSSTTREAPELGQSPEQQLSKSQQLKQVLQSRTTLVGALFIFAYQGAEVSISGWVISFLINYRGSDPGKVGYVTAGFWGGITLGRFVLSYAAHRIGEKAFTYGLEAGAIGFQLLVWFLPNIIGDSVGIAILGLLLGPIYPCGTTVFARLLPRSMQNTAMAFISSAGSTGGAIAPFLTGVLAQAAGTWVLNPVCITMFVLMEICWFALPKTGKRRE